MNRCPHSLVRPAMRLAAIGATALLASCGGSEAVDTGQSSDEPVEAAETELTITLTSDQPENRVPAWEEFEATVWEIMRVEVVTAIGDFGDGNSVVGDSCEGLQADYPEIEECVEDISLSRESGPEMVIGNLNPDGTLTIPPPEVLTQLSIEATSLVDDLCFFSAFTELSPGETSVTLPIEEACA